MTGFQEKCVTGRGTVGQKGRWTDGHTRIHKTLLQGAVQNKMMKAQDISKSNCIWILIFLPLHFRDNQVQQVVKQALHPARQKSIFYIFFYKIRGVLRNFLPKTKSFLDLSFLHNSQIIN